MKPDDYTTYAQTIDIFSKPSINRHIDQFINIVAEISPEDSSFLDIGGGTGYVLNRILENRIDITQAVLIEPSSEMFSLAKNNKSKSTKLINKTFIDSLNELPSFDNILLCRSLYSFSGDIQYYEVIFKAIVSKLAPYGLIFILEPNILYNIKEYEKQLEKKEGLPRDIFIRHWPILKQALQRFNQGIENAEFTLFTKDKLLKITEQFGFSPLIINEPIYVFRKNI
jgi:SAM-dependent methyltransferase